eukprot:scaffold191331_cov30-Tisochrysis_lutea.AAC.1
MLIPFLPVGRATSYLAHDADDVAGATPVSVSQQGPPMRRLRSRSSRHEGRVLAGVDEFEIRGVGRDAPLFKRVLALYLARGEDATREVGQTAWVAPSQLPLSRRCGVHAGHRVDRS